MKIAERMTRIGIESAFEVLMRARALEAQGKHIIHLEIGQPDFPTPQHVKDAAKRALDEGWTGYGPTPGFPDFREAIAEYISRTRGITVSGKNVVGVPGGKPIMFFTMMAVLEPGLEGLRPVPWLPRFPRGDGRLHFAHARHHGKRQGRRRRPRRQADHVLHRDGGAGAGGRGHLSDPRRSNLRVDDQLPRRYAGAD